MRTSIRQTYPQILYPVRFENSKKRCDNLCLLSIDFDLEECRGFSSKYRQFIEELVLVITTVIVLIWMLNRSES